MGGILGGIQEEKKAIWSSYIFDIHQKRAAPAGIKFFWFSMLDFYLAWFVPIGPGY